MAKLKTCKAFKKRFKITATGKIKYKRASGSHLMSSKSPKRRRRIAKRAILHAAIAEKYKVRM